MRHMTETAAWRVCLDFGTAFSKAACAPALEDPHEAYARARPLAIGRIAGLQTPYMAPCVVFVDGARVLFGEAALDRARAQSHEGREALRSFKTVLSGRGALAGLKMRVSRHIDPSNGFVLRDLTVAYLAWLQTLTARALSTDLSRPADEAFTVRYTRPAWGVGEASQTEARVSRLIDEGAVVSQLLGNALLNPDGIDIATLRPALTFSETAVIGSRVEACVLEPVAAASLGIGPGDTFGREHSAWVVLDIGAGTADLAGVQWLHGSVQEIPEARRGLVAAGDEIDRVVTEQVIAAARHVRTIQQKTETWRRLMTEVRSKKVELFVSGKTTFTVEGKPVTVRRADVEKERDFRRIRNAIADAFGVSLRFVADSEGARTSGVVNVILAGGGASLRFIHDIATQGRVRGEPASVRTRLVPVGAEWRRRSLSNLDEASVTQLAIALGGVVTPVSLLTDVHLGVVTQSYPLA